MQTIKNSLYFIVAALFVLGGAPAWAQDNDGIENGGIEEVIVTGSYIKGTPEDAELPVDVITNEDLEDIGSPSIIELVRNLGVTGANLGETNQFTTSGQANEGLATVNLRGLGAARTLVLINGRRHVATELDGLDINAFPISSIGRVEILKDGAAAVYGSDAIGGVANFITREGFEGFEISGSFQDVDGSDGDWDVNVIFGATGDGWNWMVAGEYGERGELPIREKDWALVTTAQNTPGGWSGIGNPANILFGLGYTGTDNVIITTPNPDDPENPDERTVANVALSGAIGGVQPDAQCGVLGALRSGAAGCGFQYTYFDNLIELTESAKIYTELNFDLSDNHHLHIEALYSKVDLPEWKTSPSYPPQSLFGPDRVVALSHPGLVDYLEQYPQSNVAINGALLAGLDDPRVVLAEGETARLAAGGDDGSAGTNGMLAPTSFVIPINRAFGVVGRFGTGEAEAKQRLTETYRFAIGLDGELLNNNLSYDISASWSRRDRFIGGQDMYVERMGLALRGYGGPNCQLPEVMADGEGGYELVDGGTAAGTSGCEYYNPFSRALQFSAINGATNPDYNPEVANSEELLRWLIGERGWDRQSDLLVFEAVFSGDTGWEIGGGTVGYAFGVQSRKEEYDSDFWDIADRAVNPCPYTLPVSAALGLVDASQLNGECDAKTGVAAFLAASDEETTKRTVYGAFVELAIPLTETINVQAALRYENYRGNVGSTVDPKVAASWHITDSLSLRGSASTTFRGPPQSILGGTQTALSFVGPTNAFKAVDTVGNPDLESESAVSTNLGLIYQSGGLYASIDWYSFTFEDSFQTESFNAIIGAYSGGGCQGNLDADGEMVAVADRVAVDNATCNALREHIFPIAAHTNVAGVERIVINYINGEEIKTSGIDVAVSYDFEDVGPGTLTLGFQGSHLLEYERDDLLDITGAITLAQGGDLAGQLNYNLGSAFTSKPQLKYNASLKYRTASHFISALARYVDDYEDTGAPASHPHLSTIDDHLTWDAHYNFTGIPSLTLSVSVINLTDEDPPAARGDLNYDPFTHNAFGRMVKFGAKYQLGE